MAGPVATENVAGKPRIVRQTVNPGGAILAAVKVLIADDSAMVRRNVRRLLTTLGTVSSYLETESVASTLETIAREVPDVIILDLHLVDGSGFEVLSVLREHPHNSLVIVLTAFSGSLERRKAMKLGANYFLDKTTEYEELFELLALPKGVKDS